MTLVALLWLIAIGLSVLVALVLLWPSRSKDPPPRDRGSALDRSPLKRDAREAAPARNGPDPRERDRAN